MMNSQFVTKLSWFVLLIAPAIPAQVVNADTPNIVFLLTDDQAKTTVGIYGNDKAQTPNLDELARDGIVFDRHYVTTSICMASRANIMTGLLEFRTGCNFERGNMKPDQWQASYPMLLRKNGYRTAFAGKFGFTIEGQKALPAEDFDYWGGGEGQTKYATKANPTMAKYAKKYPHATLSYGAFSQDFIRDSVSANKPFCLSISFKASHRPVTPDPKFNNVYANTIFDLPANYGRESGKHLAEQSRTGRQFPRFEEWGYSDNYNNVMRKYHQQIHGVDAALKMIRDELEKQNVADKTVIIFTADNGFMCGAHGYGSKVIPYEESMCVPLIIFDPRSKVNGQRSDSLTGSIDFHPTILELAGIKPPKNIDGVSLLPLLREPSTEVRKSLPIMNFWGPRTTHFFGVVTKKWKYLYWYSQEDSMSATEELFDMQGDRFESVNAAQDDKHLSDLNSMRDIYEKRLYEINDNAINDEFRTYKTLFDRKQPWDAKVPLLDKAIGKKPKSKNWNDKGKRKK
jgi:arylsulfatase A-like enzyme